MSMSSAMNSSVAGLAANATRLASISDNIANSSTYGYKRMNTEFESMVITQNRSAGTYTAGGVRAFTGRLIDEKGALVGTSHPLDIAIAGRGMLPVIDSVHLPNLGTGDRHLMMTHTGSFRTDANGVLRTDSGLVLMGWPANADGSIPIMPRDTTAGLEPVVINPNQTSADPTQNMTLGVNLPATDTLAGAPGTTWPLKVEYFGNLGTSESLDITFTPDTSLASGMSNRWTMVIRDEAMDPANNIIGEYILDFDAGQTSGGRISNVTTVSGGAYDPTTGALALTVAGGPISVNIGRPGDANGITQLSDDFSPTNVTKDGSPVGNLLGVEIDEYGYLKATYDTGFIRTIYQIPLIDVPNPNGLISLNNQAYKISPSSGSFFLWDAGDGPTGAVAGYAREASATDIAAELTSLIQTQRAYSSNAKVVQTVDEMFQETTNLKR